MKVPGMAAIVGIGVRLPSDLRGPVQLAEFLSAKRCAIGEFPAGRFPPDLPPEHFSHLASLRFGECSRDGVERYVDYCDSHKCAYMHS